MILTRTQIIRRAIGDVFATVADAGEFATWNPTIKESRRLDQGDIGRGSRFEWKLRGFGNVAQELDEFERNARIRIAPQLKMMSGGHRFLFSEQDGGTRIDHELEMNPRGVFKLLTPMMRMTGQRNLRDTADALQRHLEGAS